MHKQAKNKQNEIHCNYKTNKQSQVFVHLECLYEGNTLSFKVKEMIFRAKNIKESRPSKQMLLKL